MAADLATLAALIPLTRRQHYRRSNAGELRSGAGGSPVESGQRIFRGRAKQDVLSEASRVERMRSTGATDGHPGLREAGMRSARNYSGPKRIRVQALPALVHCS